MKDSAVVQDKTQNGSIFVSIQSVLAVYCQLVSHLFHFCCFDALSFLGSNSSC